MSDGTLGRLVIELGANTARLQSDMGKAVGIVERGAAGIKKSFAFLGAGVGGGVIGGALLNAAKAAITLGDDLQKAAIKAGVGGRQMSELAYAARMADVDLTSLSTALKKMQVSLSQAASGGKEQNETLRALGLRIEDIKGLKADKQFELLADRIASLSDPADRARAAVEVFGKAGADLLPLFSQGAEGIRKAREEAAKLGFSFDDGQLKRLADADDAIKRLGSSWDAFALTLTEKVAPALTRILDMASSGKLSEIMEGWLKGGVAGAFIASSDQQLALPNGTPSFSPLGAMMGAQYSGYTGEAARAFGLPNRQGGDRGTIPGYGPSDGGKSVGQIAEEAAEKARAAWEDFNTWFDQAQTDLANELFADYDQNLNRQIDAEVEMEQARLALAEEFYDAMLERESELQQYRDQMARESSALFKDVWLSAWDDMVNTGKINLGELVKYAAAQLARLQFTKFLDNPSSWLSDAGRFLGSLAGGSVDNSTASWIDDFKADGGLVQAGKNYIVGERGMELFRPGVSGSIVPNHKLGGGGSFVANISISGANDPRSTARIVTEALRKYSDELERSGALKAA